MINKKLLATAVAAAMTLGVIASPMQIFAATTDQAVNVTYDNTSVVPDPDNPNTPMWGVSVQTAITFLDTAKTRNADVALVGVNGHVLADLPDNLNVEVQVKSAKGMKLELADPANTDPVDYTLAYGATNVTGTAPIKVADLRKNNAVVQGVATLTGVAQVKGSHKDVLTYTIEGKTIQSP